MENEWLSEPLCPSCSKPSNVTTVVINQDISVEEDLLIECLIRESSENTVDEIPSEFYKLAKSITKPTNDRSTKDDQLIITDKQMWINFGQWLGLNKPITRRDVRRHLKLTWRRLEHAVEVRKTKASEIPEEIEEIKGKGSVATKNKIIASAQNNKIENFRYVTNPECIVDKHNRTLVHLGNLDDYNAVSKATEAINSYYFHMIAHPIHRSKSFWKNLAERFGAFINYTTLRTPLLTFSVRIILTMKVALTI